MIHPEIFRGTLYYWFKKKLNSNRNNHLSLRGWCLLKKLNKMATVFTLYTVRVLHFNPNNFDQYLSPYYVTILYDINIVFKMSCVQFSDERFRIPGLLLSIYGVPAFRSLIWISISKLCHWKDLALETWYFNSFFPIKIFSHTIYHLQCIWNALRCCDSSSAAMIDPTTERQPMHGTRVPKRFEYYKLYLCGVLSIYNHCLDDTNFHFPWKSFEIID